MSGNRDEGAMRIMEALSDVDEELLERSGKSSGKTFNAQVPDRLKSGVQTPGSRKKPLWQRTKAWAAILCLAVAGGMAWGGYHLEIVRDKNNNANSSGMMSEGGAVNGNQFSVGAGMDMESGVNTENSLLSAGTSQKAGITEEEARNLGHLGSYVPKALPEGYVFRYAYSGMESRIPGKAPDWLEITWIRGEDRIVLSVKEESFCDTVDVGNPEVYDVRLYRKPYVETVPEEYRAVFQDPVFALEDFDGEIVKSRMIPVEEGGKDTGTCEGNFGVLYTDNVLVRFSGIGTAEEIWEMFRSIEE